MSDESMFYNSSTLWCYSDRSVTSNFLNFSIFTYQSCDQDKLQTSKFKIVIYGKASSKACVNLYNSDLYKYMYNVKKLIIDKLGVHVNEIKKDKKYSDGFCHFGVTGVNIYTTIMYNSLLDSPCVRIMLGEKERTILDSDKIYIPLIEFTSFYLTLTKAFDNYCMMSNNMMILEMLKNIKDKIDTINVPVQTSSFGKFDMDSVDSNSFLNNLSLENESKKESESESKQEDDVVEESDFDNFLKDKPIDSYKLDLPEEETVNEEKTVKEIKHENFFREKILKNDFNNLDKIITNCVNTPNPLDTFVKTIYGVSGLDLYDGISNYDKYAVNYLISKKVKGDVNRFLTGGVNLPKKINPILLRCELKQDLNTQNRVDTMYFLLMSFMYYSKIKNDLETINDDYLNKNFVAYCLKMITSPFVFTHMLDINKDIFVKNIVDLYSGLRKDGFFDSYENEIYQKTRVNVVASEQYFKEQLSKLYDIIQQKKDDFYLDCVYKRLKHNLGYDDFKKVEKTFTSENINKIILIDTCYCSSKMDQLYDVVKTTDDVDKYILNKYNISESRFDNTILVNYIVKKEPNFKYLEQIKNINRNVYDVLNDININDINVDILKVLYFWNRDYMPSNITSSAFEKMVDDSKLTFSELISMINDNTYVVDNSFYNSILIS